MQPPAPGVPPQPGQSPYPPRPQSQPGYGWQPAPGYGPPPDYGRQPGYGQFPYGPGGYRQPGSGPTSRQVALWITLGVVVFLGLLGAILTLTLLLDVASAVNRVSQMCNQFGGQLSDLCKQSLPTAAMVYLVLIILGSLVALGGAVLMLLKKQFGQFLILGGGLGMLLFAMICSAQYGGTGRVLYDLIAGIFIAMAGGLLLVPQIREFLGLPTTGPRPGQYGGGQQPYPQPYPGQYGQPWSGGYPPRQW